MLSSWAPPRERSTRSAGSLFAADGPFAQFDWVRSRLPGRPQPVPPIFQPEVAARAIVWSIDHPRRELYVGFPTWKAIVGNKIVPGLADWYLARTGYEAQQTDEPVRPDRRDNLFAPVPGDHGAHGAFDARARATSVHAWATMHRRTLGAVGALLAGIALTARVLRSSPAGSR